MAELGGDGVALLHVIIDNSLLSQRPRNICISGTTIRLYKSFVVPARKYSDNSTIFTVQGCHVVLDRVVAVRRFQKVEKQAVLEVM